MELEDCNKPVMEKINVSFFFHSYADIREKKKPNMMEDKVK